MRPTRSAPSAAPRRSRRTLRSALLAILTTALLGAALAQDEPALLTDPFLQLPTDDSVRVVWFTEFAGSAHRAVLEGAEGEAFDATTLKMSRVAEDERSRVGEQSEDGAVFDRVTPRDVWRHEAIVTGLEPGVRVPYRVVSVTDDGTEITSDAFTLAPLPAAGQGLRILLTSDHQLKAMTPANLQKVEEAVGRVDAVLLAGDLVNIPDRASEWFDDNRGWAFFPALQGNAVYTLEQTLEEDGVRTTTEVVYRGGELIQHAPLFPALGNHEVMGRTIPAHDLGTRYNDPRPRDVTEARYEQVEDLVNPSGDPEVRENWIRDNSFNSVTYRELFTLPDDGPDGEGYYFVRFGDVALVSLYATRIWRTPSLGDGARGKYREPEAALSTPDAWGYGDFIFEDLAVGSEQYAWLQETLRSDAFRSAPYRIVMMHQGPHGVGDNYNPVFAHPQQGIDTDELGRVTAVRYEYPIGEDILVRDVEPLLNEASVQLVHQGHSHVWFRITNDAGVTFMETSNVGNTYGCYVDATRERGNVPDDPRWNAENYVRIGDPHGLEPALPSEFSPQVEGGEPLPCLASNELTAFSILDTAAGEVRSYVYDTRRPGSDVRIFDRLPLD